jgi:hypothetical protein
MIIDVQSAEGSQLSMKDWLEKMRAMREVIADEVRRPCAHTPGRAGEHSCWLDTQ